MKLAAMEEISISHLEREMNMDIATAWLAVEMFSARKPQERGNFVQ